MYSFESNSSKFNQLIDQFKIDKFNFLQSKLLKIDLR